MMRKLIAILLCLCLVCALLTGCGGSDIGQYKEDAAETQAPEEDEAPAEDETPAEDEAPAEDETPVEDEEEPAEDEEVLMDDDMASEADDGEPMETPDPGLGFTAYEPDTVVATYNDSEITWREYYYWLNDYVEYIRSYVEYMAYMGGTFSGWDGYDFSPDMTTADMVRSTVHDILWQYRSLELLADREGVVLTEDDLAEIQTMFEDMADNYGDGDGECTQEELTAYEGYMGEAYYMDRELFDYMGRISALSEKTFAALYGDEAASDLPDEDAQAYGEQLGLMSCKHILLMTVDPTTGEPLSEEEIAEKKELIDGYYNQLAEVEDDQEALVALFDELMNEHSEDTGLAAFPNGYLFGPGEMVAVFEETTAALPEYGLSEPVESSYGYHIILRQSIDPDGTFTDGNGSMVALRYAAANEDFFRQLDDITASADIVWNDDFETIDIGVIFGE